MTTNWLPSLVVALPQQDERPNIHLPGRGDARVWCAPAGWAVVVDDGTGRRAIWAGGSLFDLCAWLAAEGAEPKVTS